MTLQTEVQNAETRLLALLNKLKTDGDVEVIKLGTKGAINSLVAIALDWRGYEVIDDSPSAEQFELEWTLTTMVRDSDPAVQMDKMLRIFSQVIDRIYTDRTLSGTVYDTKVEAGEVDVVGEKVPESGQGYGTMLGRQSIIVQVQIATAT
tara:strand:+ start:686 stop:1135 length:450 start_codon:yes stop_codon:yes gene_type:complete